MANRSVESEVIEYFGFVFDNVDDGNLFHALGHEIRVCNVVVVFVER